MTEVSPTPLPTITPTPTPSFTPTPTPTPTPTQPILGLNENEISIRHSAALATTPASSSKMMANLNVGFYGHEAYLLKSGPYAGKILFIANYFGNSTAVTIYDPNGNGQATALTPLISTIDGLTLTSFMTDDGYVIIAGGNSLQGVTQAKAQIYNSNFTYGSVSSLPNLSTAISAFSVSKVQNKIYLMGGFTMDANQNHLPVYAPQVYDPITKSFYVESLGISPNRYYHTSEVSPIMSDTILLFGGTDATDLKRVAPIDSFQP